MSYRQRKLARESMGSNGYESTRYLTTEGLRDVFGNIFKGVFGDKKPNDEQIRKIKKDGPKDVIRERVKLIKLINETFLNDKWLDEQTFVDAQELQLDCLRDLLVTPYKSGRLVDAITHQFPQGMALADEYINKHSVWTEFIWNEYEKVAKELAHVTDEDKIYKAFDDVTKAVRAKDPIGMFDKPRAYFGCVVIKHNKGKGESFTQTEVDVSNVFSTLTRDELKVLAEHLIDVFEPLIQLPDRIYSAINGIDYDTHFEGDESWWDVVSGHDFFMDYYYQSLWDSHLPESLVSKESASTYIEVDQLYIEAIVKLLFMHIK